MNGNRRRVGDATDVGLLNGPRGKAILKLVDPQEVVFEFVWGQPLASLLPIDLIVGLSRPQTSRKILQEATSLGVRRILFLNTDRGEPSYATSKLWTTSQWQRLVHMPGMDGYELAHEINQLCRRQIIDEVNMVMLSSADGIDSEQRCAELGIRGFIAKPIKQSDLLELLTQAVNRTVAQNVTMNELIVEVPRFHRRPERALRILIAEDNQVNQNLMLRILSRDNPEHEVLIANNGKEACVLAKQYNPEIILMDVQMPEMDGMEATAEIRRRENGAARVPIIALTAHAISGYRQRCLDAGMDSYVTKPVNVAELMHVITELIENPVETPELKPDSIDQATDTNREKTGSAVHRDELVNWVGADAEFIASLASTLQESCTGHLGNIRSGLQNHDFTTIRNAAHTLKGSTGSVCAKQASQLAFELQKAAEQESHGDCLSAASAFEQQIEEVYRSLEELVAELNEVSR